MAPARPATQAAPPPAAARPRPAAGVVVGVDLAGIQRFVYEGRRLLDAIGRATLMADLTDPAGPHLAPLLADLPAGSCAVLRDAGGALYIAFTDPRRAADHARAFTGRYTRRLRDLSDQLNPVVAHVPYGGPGSGPATQAEALRLLPSALQAARAVPAPGHLPALGVGVTAACDITGRPAELLDHTRDRGPVRERAARDIVTARVRARQWHDSNTRTWLRGLAPPPGADRLELPTDVDHLGREIGDLSRLAVIHLDFNGLGDLLKRYHAALDSAGADVVAHMRTVSADIARLTEGLAQAVIRAVAGAVTTDPDTGEPAILGHGAGGRLRPHVLRGAVHVPVRPVVVAGDDLTVICDARLAWSVTRFALDWLDTDPALVPPGDPRAAMAARAAEPPWTRRLGATGRTTGVPSAGIGIAVQPVGAPLSVGYDICAALCDTAKEHRKAAEHRMHDHVVAWSHVFDDPVRVVARLHEDRAGSGRTALPMPGADFRAFLRAYLDPAAPGSLRSAPMAGQRSWLLSRLAPLLQDGRDPAPELDRRRDIGLPVRLPEPFDRGLLLDAIGLLDLHLDVPLAHRPPPPREEPARP
ncbi:hypothetical protein LG943_18955 [Streptomonospora sp. S1-112]|uniref:Uncharacterized protein n=1 Tax=Streptomonospora mangrovi TaxID=2883123 RepID=A0A9X3NN67_9ACTN|nr:hypothetical protein [Streptomonospora mangrovi]MDA0566378.1 hypothetical protein [Streptomonospora mangrovi]